VEVEVVETEAAGVETVDAEAAKVEVVEVAAGTTAWVTVITPEARGRASP